MPLIRIYNTFGFCHEWKMRNSKKNKSLKASQMQYIHVKRVKCWWSRKCDSKQWLPFVFVHNKKVYSAHKVSRLTPELARESEWGKKRRRQIRRWIWKHLIWYLHIFTYKYIYLWPSLSFLGTNKIKKIKKKVDGRKFLLILCSNKWMFFSQVCCLCSLCIHQRRVEEEKRDSSNSWRREMTLKI